VIAPTSSRYEGRAVKTGAAAAVIVYVALYWLNGLVFDINSDPMMLLLESTVQRWMPRPSPRSASRMSA
jgi:hypothetical protein